MVFQNFSKKISSLYSQLIANPKLLLIIVLIVALLPRLLLLTTSPQITLDESANFSDILKMVMTNHISPALPQWDKSQALLDYYPTFFLFKLGIFDEFFTLRLTSVIWSIIGITAFFFIIKKFTCNNIAFLTSLIFSYSYYYLEFSRIGWSTIHALALGLSALLASLIASEKKSKLFIIVSGILAGLAFYSYRGGEIYIASALILLIVQLVRSNFSKINLRLLLIFCIVFFLTAFPWITYIENNWGDFTSRQTVVSINNVKLPYMDNFSFDRVYLYQTEMTLKSWIFMIPTVGNAGNRENPQYLPLWYPPINPFLIPFFWVGLLFAIKKWRKYYIFLFIFFAGLFFGQILTVYPPNGSRALVTLPMIYFFIGLSIFWLFQKFKKTPQTQLSIFLFCLLICISDFLYYFYWMSWIRV